MRKRDFMGYMGRLDNATKVASPKGATIHGAATSVAENGRTKYANAIEIASPRGAATSVADISSQASRP